MYIHNYPLNRTVRLYGRDTRKLGDKFKVVKIELLPNGGLVCLTSVTSREGLRTYLCHIWLRYHYSCSHPLEHPLLGKLRRGLPVQEKREGGKCIVQ